MVRRYPKRGSPHLSTTIGITVMDRPSYVRQPVVPDLVPSGYMPHLDAVRAIALGFVLVEHFGGRAVNAYIPFGAGSIGVNLFFVLSGYLVTGILLDTFKQHENGPAGARKLFNFYMRRVLRLTPVLYVTI